MTKAGYRVSDLLREFDWAARDFYIERGRSFENFPRGASGYFHQRLIQLLRAKASRPSLWVGDEPYLVELLYAMLAAWGMDGRKARLVDFPIFRETVLRLIQSRPFNAIEGQRLHAVNASWRTRLLELWRILSEEARIMASESVLVGSSKLLHHLLPDLFPPVDRTYTLAFLHSLDSSEPYRISASEHQYPEFETFYKVMLFFSHVSRSVPNIEAYVNKDPMSGSVPKIIDNVIITWWGTE